MSTTSPQCIPINQDKILSLFDIPMIDTLSIVFPAGGSLTEEAQSVMNEPDRPSPTGWTHSYGGGRNPAGLPYKTGWFCHLKTGLRVFPKPDGTFKLEYSAPKMLRDDNATVIRSDEELAAAIAQALTTAADIVSLYSQGAYYQRIDSTAYVAISPSLLLHLFEKVKHPSCHGLPVSYPGESLTIPGSNQKFLMYDKRAEQGRGTGDVRTRIEVQVSGPKISERYKLGQKQRLLLYDLSVAKAYAALRQYVAEFKAVQVAAPYSSDQLLAQAIVRNVRAPDGRHLLDWRTEGMETGAAKRLRRKIEALSLSLSAFRWADYLPANPTPAQLVQLTEWSPPRRAEDFAA